MTNRLLINYIAEPAFDQELGISFAQVIDKPSSAWRPNLDLVCSDAIMVFLAILYFFPIHIHEKPNCSGKYFSLFRAPVHFGAESDSILFSYDDLDLRLPSGNQHLASISDQMMIEYMANLDRENIIHRVKSAIIEHMHDGKITANKIAKEVFMSVRSLHRNLKELGTTFGSILDEVRREFAEHYVSDTREDLTEVAFRLGFSQQSSFARAFKRWTGMSPSAYRADSKNKQ